MVTTQLEKLHKKPHVATPGTGTPCRVHVLQYIIKKILQRREVANKKHQKYVTENTRDANTMGKAKSGVAGADPIGALGNNRQ